MPRNRYGYLFKRVPWKPEERYSIDDYTSGWNVQVMLVCPEYSWMTIGTLRKRRDSRTWEAFRRGQFLDEQPNLSEAEDCVMRAYAKRKEEAGSGG